MIAASTSGYRGPGSSGPTSRRSRCTGCHRRRRGTPRRRARRKRGRRPPPWKARTGEFTPPGITRRARANSAAEIGRGSIGLGVWGLSDGPRLAVVMLSFVPQLPGSRNRETSRPIPSRPASCPLMAGAPVLAGLTSAADRDSIGHMTRSKNLFSAYSTLETAHGPLGYYRLDALRGAGVELERLPFTIRVLLESRAAQLRRLRGHRRRREGAWRPGTPARRRKSRCPSSPPASSCRTSPACPASSTWPPCAPR